MVMLRHLTTELSDAGGPRRPHWQLTWPARVRSSDLVRLFLHHLTRSVRTTSEPTNPPTPIKSVLRTGPTGLWSVLIAIVAATRKPMAVPTAVAFVAASGIHFSRPASHAAAQLPSSPPKYAPTKRTRCARAAPAAEPISAQKPTTTTSKTNILTCFITSLPNDQELSHRRLVTLTAQRN